MVMQELIFIKQPIVDCAKYNKWKDVDWMDLILEVLRGCNASKNPLKHGRKYIFFSRFV